MISIDMIKNNFTHHDFKYFLKDVPILQLDIIRGDFTSLILTSKLAKDKSIWIAPHLFPELTIHILASIQNSSWLEYMGWLDHSRVNPIIPIDGFMVPSNRPKQSMDFKPEILNS